MRAAAALAGLPVPLAQSLLDRLVSANLVEQRRAHRYELHDLIRLYATQLAEEAESADVGAVRRVLEHRAQWAARHGRTGHAWRIAGTMTTFLLRAIPAEDGVDLLTNTLAVAEAAGETTGVAYLHYWLGRSQVDLGNLDVVRSHAVEHYLRAIAALTGSHDTEVEAWSHYHLARAYSHLRDFPNAVRAFRRAITLNRVGGNRRWEAIILADLATTLTHAGHPALARSAWQTALAT